MEKPNTVFIGCDVSDKTTEMCVLDAAGAVVDRSTVKTTRQGIARYVERFERARVVLEVGTHSRWIAAALNEHGHEVIVANPRQVRLIWKRPRKTDQSDALILAKLGRFDVTLLAPVKHRSASVQADLACLRARDQLVATRSKLVNHVRGAVKPFGVRIERCGIDQFADHAERTIPDELRPALEPTLEAIRALTSQIATHDKQIEHLATVVYPDTAKCTQIFGVGILTALAFMLTMEDPRRFKTSRFAAAFFGLVPGKDQSGDSDPQKHVTKAGDPLVRKLLVECAHRILSPTRFADSDLRRWALRIAERGGKNGRKRATVALARKLAVLMHRLWITGERYEPVGYIRQQIAS